jgi:hypothetical protein
MFVLWIRPIRWAYRIAVVSILAAVVFRLGAWLLLSPPAGEIRTLGEMRAELRYAIRVNGTVMFTLLGAVVLLDRAPGWGRRFLEVMDDLADSGRVARLPAWPALIRLLAVGVADGALGLTVAAALDVDYALLRDVGLTSVDQQGASGVAFWALYLWTTGLWALFGGCYFHAWALGRAEETAQRIKSAS